jgi:serine/threonine-protein kinase
MRFVIRAALVRALLLTPLLLTTCNTSTTSPDPPSTTSSLTAYDGTYDYGVTVRGRTLSCSDCFYIIDGQIYNSEGSFSGRVTDSFGNLEFSGPCPTASCLGNCGTFTGQVNWGAGPGFGEGQWECPNGNTDRWWINNGTRGTPSPPAASTCSIHCWACSSRYGAIAMSPSTGACGVSWDYSTRTKAENRAIQECGQGDCAIRVWFRNACGALAVGSNLQWGVAWAGTYAEASTLALNECNSR